MNIETKVGLFVTLGLGLIGFAVFLLGDFSIYNEYSLYVEFNDVAGLPDKSIVKLSGVEVGKVKSIKIRGKKVIVELAIRDEFKIYRDSVFQIGSTSIIGSKFMQIDQGSPSSGILGSGATIKGLDSPPLDKMITNTMGSLQLLLEDINQKGNFGKQLNYTMINVRELTAKLNDLIAVMQPHLDNSMASIDSMTNKLDKLIAKADTLIANINEGKGAVGALVSDESIKQDITETVKNVKEVSAKAKKIMENIGGFKVHWLYSYKYEPQAMASRNYAGVRISPRKGRYYQMGVANIGNEDDEQRATDYVEKNQFDLRLGFETERIDFYAGLIRGAGGLGIKYKPLPDTPVLKKVSVLGEATDFQRNRVINGRRFDHPDYTLGGEIEINEFVKIGMRTTDIQGTGNTQYTASLKFEDKDIAYLLGLVSLGTIRGTGN